MFFSLYIAYLNKVFHLNKDRDHCHHIKMKKDFLTIRLNILLFRIECNNQEYIYLSIVICLDHLFD